MVAESISREDFIAAYCARSGISPELLMQHEVVLPCRCGEPICEGWAVIPNDLRLIEHHEKTDAIGPNDED